jgi:ArsR family transcriptional regulator, arsenate/arsenite/antimonite-responsive transcriptional repressor
MSRNITQIFKALSDDTRIDIVKNLLTCEEISCQEIQQRFTLSQPTLSFHFNKLINAEILFVRKVGTSHIYSVNSVHLLELGIDIQKLVNN